MRGAVTDAAPDFAILERRLAEHGLIARGGFHPAPEDGVPGATLVLVGNAGPALWRVFAAAPEARDGAADPLNRWSRRVLGALAMELGAEALYPFDGPPYRPFVAWAKRAEAVAESPLGMLIHPDYGLWHAYRGALAFDRPIELPPRDPRSRPCDACADKPCLKACPVEAFAATGYDVAACAAHVAAPEGEDCLGLGCRARRACPVGPAYSYDGPQARFHMEAFLKGVREQ